MHEKIYKNVDSNVVRRIRNWKENTHVSPLDKIIHFRGKKNQISPKADSKHCLCKTEYVNILKGFLLLKMFSLILNSSVYEGIAGEETHIRCSS